MNSQSVQSPHHFSNLPPALHQQQQPHGSNMASPSPSSSSTPSSPSSSQHHHHQHYIQLQQSYLDFAAAHHHHHQHPHQQQSSPSSYPNAHQQQQQQQQPQPGQQSHPSSKVNSELIVQHPDLFIQQQYEQKIRALQMEIQAMKQAMLCFNHGNSNCNNTPNPSNHNLPKKSSTRSSTNHNNDQQHIVETYCEEICIKEFSCKNCSYKTKSEASLIIHNTNHLVSQRYLHLPTTVFSTKASQEQASAHTFLYPCGECTGKYSHNDLYLHIYQHHTGENPFHCDECNLFFMHYEFLDNHQRTEHMKSENHYQQKNKKSRYYDPNNMSPHLTYYSVVKCSKPFTSFVPINTVGRQSNSAWNNQPASNNQPAFPYVTKRGRGRASHHSVGNRTSSFQNLLQTTASVRAQSSSKTVSNNNNSRGSDMQFKCHYEDCFFAADSQERLDFHLFAHRNSRFKCPYCPYVSNVLNDIKRHCVKGQKHDGLMFTCPNCDHMQTNCDKTFKDHIRNVHFNKMIDDKMLQNFIEDLFLNNTSNPSQPTVTHP